MCKAYVKWSINRPWLAQNLCAKSVGEPVAVKDTSLDQHNDSLRESAPSLCSSRLYFCVYFLIFFNTWGFQFARGRAVFIRPTRLRARRAIEYTFLWQESSLQIGISLLFPENSVEPRCHIHIVSIGIFFSFEELCCHTRWTTRGPRSLLWRWTHTSQ